MQVHSASDLDLVHSYNVPTHGEDHYHLQTLYMAGIFVQNGSNLSHLGPTIKGCRGMANVGPSCGVIKHYGPLGWAKSNLHFHVFIPIIDAMCTDILMSMGGLKLIKLLGRGGERGIPCVNNLEIPFQNSSNSEWPWRLTTYSIICVDFIYLK